MATSPMAISVDPYTSLSYPDQNVYFSLDNTTHNNSGSGNTGTSVKSTRVHRLIAVSLGVLCAILFMSAITLCALYTTEIAKIGNRTWDGDKEKLQRDFDRVSYEKDQLQKAYDRLSHEQDQLQNNYTTLSNEKDQLQKDYDTLKEQCQPGSACPEGWNQFSSKCYFFSTDKKNWTDSQAYCEIRGADLVVIKSQDKQEFINKYAVGEFHYWIGMNDQSPGFTWVDGTTLRNEDTRWKPGAPDGDRRRNENCVFTGPSEQLWGDTQCYKLHKWICER